MKASVLIVEDERLVARELQLRLQDHGYRVTAKVASADAALAAVGAQVPDIVLMDIRLEGDRDGIAAAEALQQRHDVPVLFLSAHSDDATVARAARTGAGYLIKPPKERELVVAIEVALHKHETARQLRIREKWFATMLRSIGDAVISTDPDGRVAFMNPVAERLTGWSSGEARGLPAATVVTLVRGPDGGEASIVAALGQRETARGHGTLVDRQGRARDVVDSAAPIVDETGALLGGVMVLRDVTEQRALERQLASAERLASLGILAVGVAHELNNPLTWIIDSVTRLAEALAGGDVVGDRRAELSTDAGEALQGARRIRRIVRDLAVPSPRGADPEGCRVADAIGEALASRPPDPALTADVDGSLRVAMAAPRLVRVLSALLSNAAQAIAGVSRRAHQITVRARREGEVAIVEVHDTGGGMNAATRLRAFEPFFTTWPSGAGPGLGLAIAHGLITAAGGSIAIAETSHAGTTVVVTLPIAAPEPPAPARPAAPPAHARILAIDDEAPLRKLVARVLRAHAIEAVEPEDALARLQAGQRYDLILCDITMPRLSGIDLHAAVVALDPEQARRFVFVTGGAVDVRSSEFLATTTYPILGKPFTPAQLEALVAEQLATLGRIDVDPPN